jgi:hypothetical protein
MDFMEQNGNTLKFTSREIQLAPLPVVADIVDLADLHTCVVNEMERRRAQAALWSQSPLTNEKGHAQTLLAEVSELGVLEKQMTGILNPNPVDAIENYANRQSGS